MGEILKLGINKNLQQGLKKIGELLSYTYLFTIFFNSKVNMKIGYLLLVVVILYFIFNREEVIKVYKKNKKIYQIFFIIFILGIIWNFLSAGSSSVNKFININGRFIYGFIIYIFLYGTNTLFFNIVIFLSTNILSYNFLYQKMPYLLLDDLGRLRIILSMGIVYVLIYILTKFLKNFKNVYLLMFLILPFVALVKTKSRMTILGIIVVLILYFVFKILEDRKNTLKTILILFLLFGVGILSIIKNKNYINHIKTSFHTSNNLSNQDRIVMWKAGLNIIENNFILGVGSSEKDIYPYVRDYVDKNIEDNALRNEFLLEERFARLHNMYVDFFVQNGIIGFLYLYLFFIAIPYMYLKSNRSEENTASFFTILFYYFYGLTWSLWSALGISQNLFHIILALFLANTAQEKE